MTTSATRAAPAHTPAIEEVYRRMLLDADARGRFAARPSGATFTWWRPLTATRWCTCTAPTRRRCPT